MVRRGLQELGYGDGMDDALQRIMKELGEEIGEAFAQEFRMMMRTKKFRAIGGSYSKPISASGRLGGALKVLSNQFNTQQNVGRRVRSPDARQQTISIVVGSQSSDTSGNDPSVYGAALNKSVPSRPPAITWFSPEAQERFKSWARHRAIPIVPDLYAIMAKILQDGTYGREWMRVLTDNISGSPIRGELRAKMARILETTIHANEDSFFSSEGEYLNRWGMGGRNA
jgi:hypothetical protein